MSISDALTFEPQISWWGEWKDRAAATFLRVASILTDPVCKIHEFNHRFDVVDELNPTAKSISNFARKIFLILGMIGCTLLAVYTTLPGIALRYAGGQLLSRPFIHSKGSAEDKILGQDRQFSLLSWNVCCTAGGYSISDGGVMPWSFRIDAIARKVIEKKADVNCLYETFDHKSALYLSEKLKQNGYGHVYYNIGPKTIGVTSGILVASKYKIANAEFTPFPQEALVGRTKNAAKGIFNFDLQSQGENFAHICANHLQHSEEPAFPTAEELAARNTQMRMVMEKVTRVHNRCTILTGDLNLDDEEYRASSWQHQFQKGDAFDPSDKTWGGDAFWALLMKKRAEERQASWRPFFFLTRDERRDEDAFCASVMKKRISGPLNLDHTMIVKGSAQSIHTTLVKTGFNGYVFKKEALSDHAGLYSEIQL